MNVVPCASQAAVRLFVVCIIAGNQMDLELNRNVVLR